jgi:DNA-binding transcriptional LysR family regulator
VDWESLKHFVAVAETGTLAAAGRRLGVRHTTVLRRISTLEEELGARLFDRGPDGYALTEAGREVLDRALALRAGVEEVERAVRGRDRKVAGLVRIATLAPLVPWVARAMASALAHHPDLRLEVAIAPTPVSLSRHEADVAVRVSRPPPGGLVGRRIADVAYAVYAAARLVAAGSGPEAAGALPWVAYDDARADTPAAKWIERNIAAERVVLCTHHTGLLLAAVAAGVGAGLLPCHLGDATPSLRRVSPIIGLEQSIWVLTHRDLRRTARVRAVTDALSDELARDSALFAGRGAARLQGG